MTAWGEMHQYEGNPTCWRWLDILRREPIPEVYSRESYQPCLSPWTNPQAPFHVKVHNQCPTKSRFNSLTQDCVQRGSCEWANMSANQYPALSPQTYRLLKVRQHHIWSYKYLWCGTCVSQNLLPSEAAVVKKLVHSTFCSCCRPLQQLCCL